MAETIKLMVYGSLKSGKQANDRLNKAKFVKAVKTKPEFLLLKLGWYPGIIKARAGVEGRSIQGEVYEVPVTEIASLDRYEGAPSLFKMETIALEDGEEVNCYLYNREVKDEEIPTMLVESNNW